MESLFKVKGKYKIVGSMFISLFLSLAITSLLVNISGFADSIFVSRYLGDNAMAAYSLIKPVFKFFGIITSIITSGLQIVLGTELGKGHTKTANKLFTFFFVLCFAIGIVVLILGVTIPKELAFLFGAYDMESELNQMSADFLKGILIGAPFLLVYSALLPIYSFSGARKLMILCALLTSSIDILFDWLNGEFFHLGMFGMGLSTTIGYVVAVIPMILYIVVKKTGMRFDFTGFSFKNKGSVFVLGLPKAFKSLSTSMKSLLVNLIIMAIGGSVALTASGVEGSLFGMLNVLVFPLSGVFISLACLYRLDKDKESCLHLFKIILFYTLTIATGVTVIIIACAPLILPMFNLQTTEAFDTTLLSVRIGLAAVPLTVSNYLYLSYLQVTKRIKLSNIFTVVFYFVTPIILTLLFGYTLGTVGLWIAIPLTEIVNTLISWITGCIQQKKIVNIFTALFALDKDFKDESIFQYHFEVNKKEDLNTHFPEVIKLLSDKGVGQDTLNKMDNIYQAMISREELDKSFKIKNEHNDILVSLKDGHVTLRLRNDGSLLTADQKSDFIDKRREAAKKDPSIIVLEDCLENIEVIDILNIHTIVFSVS